MTPPNWHQLQGWAELKAFVSRRPDTWTRGDSLGHISARCTCGAEGAYCTAHSRTDWGEYAGKTCAEVRRALAEVAEELAFQRREAARADEGGKA